MNQSQIGGYIRALLAFIGGALGSWFIQKGWVSQGSIDLFTSHPIFIEWTGYIIGAISLAIVGWWSQWTNTAPALAAATVAAAPPGTTTVVTTPSIAAATPAAPSVMSSADVKIVTK